jgi:integrase
MSPPHPKRIVVWVQDFGDRPQLVLQWHDPVTGKRKSKTAGTCNPLEAEKRRADLEYELNNGLYAEPSRMTWEQFRELFEAEYLEGVRPKTRNFMAKVLDHFEAICQPARVGAVDERTVSAFVAGLRKLPGRCGNATMAPYTIKVSLAFLRVALGWAVRQKLLPRRPEFPAVKAPKKKPQPVPAESFERLLAKAGSDLPMRAFLLCGWRAGLRLGEALALEWEASDRFPWVDLDRGRIWLPAVFVKGDADQWVPLDAELREALLALPRQGKKVFRFVKSGGRPLTLQAVSLRVAKLAKQAGVKLTMKTLRKGFGCYYAARVSAHVLQKLMRHADIKVTLDYYANFDQTVEDAVKGREPGGDPIRNSSRNSDGPEPTEAGDGPDASEGTETGNAT